MLLNPCGEDIRKIFSGGGKAAYQSTVHRVISAAEATVLKQPSLGRKNA